MASTKEDAICRGSTSSPSSIASGGISNDDISEERFLPSNLAAEELLLALNKEAGEEELQKAISRCRDLVLECDQCSIERKWLVRHLIELRLRLQECREALDDPEHPRNKSSGCSNRTILGHHFILQSLLKGPRCYCDHCTGSIWMLIQAWYQCIDCGYSCHHKCLSSIIRECVHVTASERGEYELSISPEVGLSAQKYQCYECKAPLPVDWSEARKCDYTGLYYCSACHWGSLAIIPARVIHNWDFTPQPVCQASLQLLKITATRPLINIEKYNSRLFSLVHELNLVKRLRYQLNAMRKYLLVCRNATAEHLLLKNIDAIHLVDLPDLYSLQDLVDTHSGELPSKLHDIAHLFRQHIKEECELCQGRAHICEICLNTQILFPFDRDAVVCNDCKSVFHQNCFSRKKTCLKCIRIIERNEKNDTADVL